MAQSTPSRLSPIATRILLAACAVLACLPLGANLAGWEPVAATSENRALASAPGWPGTLDAAKAFPAALSAYIADHYGLRSLLVQMDGRVRYRLFSEFVSDQVRMGRHGRLFFTSHFAGAPFSLTERICGTSIGPDQVSQGAAGMAQLLRVAASITPNAYYLSIPTTPVIDHDDLPRWLAKRCDRTAPYVPRLAAALTTQAPALAAHLVWPKDALDRAKTAGLPYPIWAFHWSGVGARAVTEAVAGTVLHLPRRMPLTDRLQPEPSDLAQFTPGIRHIDSVPFPDHAAAGVAFCYGSGQDPVCAQDLAPFGHAILEITRSTWPASAGPGPSLLVLSDSFGRMPAQYLSEYFATVLHLSIAFDQLHPGELAALAAQVAKGGRPDALLIIYHDGAASDAIGVAGPLATFAAAFNQADPATPAQR